MPGDDWDLAAVPAYDGADRGRSTRTRSGSSRTASTRRGVQGPDLPPGRGIGRPARGLRRHARSRPRDQDAFFDDAGASQFSPGRSTGRSPGTACSTPTTPTSRRSCPPTTSRSTCSASTSRSWTTTAWPGHGRRDRGAQGGAPGHLGSMTAMTTASVCAGRSRHDVVSPWRAARRARGCCSSRPGSSASWRSRHPDDRDARASPSPTSASTSRTPWPSSASRTTPPARATSRCSTHWWSPSGSRSSGCRSRSSLPVRVALLLNSRYAAGAAVFRVAVLPAVRGAVRGGRRSSGRHAGRGGWLNEFLRWVGIAEPPPTGCRTPTWIYPAPRVHGHLGHRCRASSSTSRACRASRPSCMTPPDRWRGLLGTAAPRDAAADVAGHLLHARAGHRGSDAVLPGAVRAEERHG